ncbi:hypothetical protein AB4144_53450, partial [Rhizobiaceae sp. 2RAB30]
VAQFQAFGDIGLYALAASNIRAKFTLAQIEALIDSGVQWRGTLSFRDSPAAIAGLSPSDIAAYAANGLKDIFATVSNDGSGFMLSLNFDVVMAMLSHGVVVARNNIGNLIGPARLVATAAEFDSLTAGQIAGIGGT